MSVKNWKNTSFESDCYRTPEYIVFEKECKKELKNICKKLGAELVSFNPSHFEWSAFVKRGTQHIYILRYFLGNEIRWHIFCPYLSVCKSVYACTKMFT